MAVANVWPFCMLKCCPFGRHPLNSGLERISLPDFKVCSWYGASSLLAQATALGRYALTIDEVIAQEKENSSVGNEIRFS